LLDDLEEDHRERVLVGAVRLFGVDDLLFLSNHWRRDNKVTSRADITIDDLLNR
jgi:hypothetical protein